MIPFIDEERMREGEFHSVSARLEEDEHTRDESREMATDGYIQWLLN